MHLEMQLSLLGKVRHALLSLDKGSYDEQWQLTRSGELAMDPAEDRQKESTR
jgi:hypothetical protein